MAWTNPFTGETYGENTAFWDEGVGAAIKGLGTSLGFVEEEEDPSLQAQLGKYAERPMWEPDPEAFGVPGYLTRRGQYQQGATDAASRQAALVQAAQIDQTRQAQARQAQMELLGQLGSQAQGIGGPSQAQLLGQMALESGARQAGMQQAANRGIGGLVQSGLSQEAAAGQATSRAAGVRAAETAAAQQQAINLMGQGRGQDLQIAGAQAGLDQQANLANQQAQMQQQQQNDKLTSYFLQQGFNLEQAQQQAMITQEQMRADQVIAQMNAQAALNQMERQMKSDTQSSRQGALGSIAGAGLAIFSDENLKEEIKPEGENIDEFMDGLRAYSYQYKNQEHGEGKRYGVMAQDIERSKLGSEIVMDLQEGKAVDVNKGISAALAGLARLNERINKVEGK